MFSLADSDPNARSALRIQEAGIDSLHGQAWPSRVDASIERCVCHMMGISAGWSDKGCAIIAKDASITIASA
jgi:hypothetical protein